MKEDFIIHNLFWKGRDEFTKRDPHLMRLEGLPFVHKPELETEIPVLTPGIYILTGGRQVGKSTLLKLIILRLLKERKVSPKQIYYLPCDTIADYNQLLFEIEQFRSSIDPSKYFVLFIDEICYVKEWDRAIKSLADAGFFYNGSAVITGSDTFILKEAMMKFPGRRGKSLLQDFRLYPLSFYEYVSLRDRKLYEPTENMRKEFQERLTLPLKEIDGGYLKRLYDLFDDYILTGGFMPALNDYARNKRICPVTYKTYIQWVVGDILKRKKQEHYLREIITAILSRLRRQVTWHNISCSTSIVHHQTVADYINLLSHNDVLSVFDALREDKLQAAPKKAKKLSFNDPFIFHSLHGWAKGKADFFELSEEVVGSSGDLKNALIEGTIAALFERRWPTYYIKAEGEVDIAIIKGNRFFPVEVKNSVTFRPGEIKQIIKYKNGIIANAGEQIMPFKHLILVPIPVVAMIAV